MIENEGSGQKLLGLHQIVRQRIACVTLETTTISTTTYSDKSGTTFSEKSKVILTFDDDTRCEIMQLEVNPGEL